MSAEVQPGHVTVPLRSRRVERVQFAQKIQHAVPAFGLVAGGFSALSAGAQGFEFALAVTGIGISALLAASLVSGVRALRRGGRGHAVAPPHHHGVDWIDISIAGVLFTEAAEKWRVHHHISGPIILTAVATLALGLFHGRVAARMERRLAVRLTDEHLFVGGPPWKRLRASWGDVKHIQLSEHEAVIRTHKGRSRRLDFKDLDNAGDVRAVLEQAQERLR